MRCAVLGSPIEHSLSPTLHRAAYTELGLEWTYDAIEVTEAGLGEFLDSCGAEWRGLSLTMPLKRAVQPLLSDRDALTAATGVANTVVLDDRGRHGLNTDIPGAIAAIREKAGPSFRANSAVVLGGGATAASLLWALGDLGCTEATLVVRDVARASETLDVVARHPRSLSVVPVALGEFEGASADVLASTIPAAAQTPELIGALDASLVFEAIYDPWPTPLAAASEAQGRAVVTGLDLLVHQAAIQFCAMTGSDAPVVDVMRSAGLAELARRSRR